MLAFSVRSVLGLSLVALSLAACGRSNLQDDRLQYVEEPVGVLYNRAADAVEKRRYQDAILMFGEVERQHPYSEWARRSMLMTAYTHYLQSNYEETIAAVDQFIAIHPGNKDAVYAYYLRAMSYYERIRDVGRDQDITRQAMTALTDVARRYPDSEYARDALLKLDLTRDHLAGKEMDVGRFYLRRDLHVAAINRFNVVLEEYQTTSHVPEALHRLVESYLELGVIPEARKYAAYLNYNFPDSEWYRDTYRLLNAEGLAGDLIPVRRAREARAEEERVTDEPHRSPGDLPVVPPPAL